MEKEYICLGKLIRENIYNKVYIKAKGRFSVVRSDLFAFLRKASSYVIPPRIELGSKV